jgi:Na+/proline symporter/signal transduction histidine kinase/PAS domain-containing protein/ActR/RegA family two-component response regulator
VDLGVVSLTAAAYAGLLFWLAWAVERRPERFGWVNRPLAYALALAVYCTSWTFYGGVGTAATGGWTYLPIYLGPILVFLFGQDFLRRLAQAVQRENLTSIADFLSSRYGKSRSLAALVTTLATLAALPYIALQLKALGMSAAGLLSGDWTAPPEPSHPAVGIIAGVLAMFAILFGARRYEAAGHNRGIVAAIAVEAVVKLAALLLLGGFAFVALADAPAPSVNRALAEFDALFAVSNLQPEFLTITLLSMAAIVCLPRQFYVGFVEYRRRADLATASWAFPLYLLLTALIVAPITLAGLAILPASVSADLFVLDLPLALGADWLALIAFLGGFSAATGMIIVECVALATMISNDLVAPFLLRRGILRERDIGAVMLSVRRIAIAGLLGLAYLYYLKLDASESLAAIGLIAFAAVAQFGPALLAAIYWPKINQRGVMLGLAAGGALWAYTLLLPAYLGADTLTAWANARGLGALLNPHALMGLSGLDPLTHGVIWSLGVNIAIMVAGSALTPAPLADRLRAAVFNPSLAVAGEGGVRTLGDLAVLVERFVGVREAEASFLAPLGAPGREAAIDARGAGLAERLIAQVIGASSARVIMTSALSGGAVDVADVVRLLDDTKAELKFSRGLLSSALDNISQGVSVVDRDLRLTAWNARYLELFEFPPGFIRVGLPIADVIRFNAERGECGPGEVDAHVARRLAAIQRRLPHAYERRRPNGTVLKTFGNPMPDGGYVTSFTDITAEKQAEEALRQAKDQLELRVEERTAALRRANADLASEAERNLKLARALAAAKAAAEEATLSKTKFLAAASHDLLQPLNAARLFTAALSDTPGAKAADAKVLIRSIDRSIAAADSLLRALLDISKLEAGGMRVTRTRFPIGALIEELASQFAPLAAAKGLSVRAAPTALWVESDRGLLRSAVQNFLSNAVRYTNRGGIVIGCRRRGERCVIEVWDTGAGIPDTHRSAIFEEFRRMNPAGDEPAAGLGLAIVDRIARLLGAEIDLRSRVGKGSVFAIDAPVAPEAPPALGPALEDAARTQAPLKLRVLCVDNDPVILDAMARLLRGWGCRPVRARSYGEAIAALHEARFDTALVDFQLDDPRGTGLDVLAAWREKNPGRPAALITADAAPALADAAEARGAVLMTKPVPPRDLRAFLERAPAAAREDRPA